MMPRTSVKYPKRGLPLFSAKRQQAGFTLIEAMMALAIFSLGFLGYIQVIFKSLDVANEYAHRVTAQILVQDMITRIQMNADAAKRTVNPNGYIIDTDNNNYSINNCQTTWMNGVAGSWEWGRQANLTTSNTTTYGGFANGSFYNQGVVINTQNNMPSTPFQPYPGCYGSMNSGGAVTSCCPTQMAQHDIQDWGLMVQQAGLPNVAAVVCIDGKNSPTSDGCLNEIFYTASNNVPYSVGVFWTNKAGVQQSVIKTVWIP